MRQETEAEVRYQDLIDDLLGRPGVTPPPGGSGFGRGAVRFQKKIFVMFVRGRLVLKLPAARVDELVAAGEGVRFDANKGTPMREWFSLDPESGLPWLPLATEALEFAQATLAGVKSGAAQAGSEEPMSVLRVRGRALPDGEPVDLYADGDRWTIEPAAGAELVAEGWLIPGLVDAHTHPGAEKPGQPLDEALLRDDLHEHVAAGVTMIRSPGLAADPPAWFGRDSDVPRAVHAGPWIAQVGQFFDGWARRASHAELPALAAAQAQRTGWAKLIGDWSVSDEPIPVDVLAAVVAAVHAVGGRVAVHAQHPGGSAAAVAAKVDSLEHGMWLDPSLLPQLAAQGTALTPTLFSIVDDLPKAASAPEGPRKDWYVGGASVHAELTAAAAEAGVTILAGTDSRPHGRVASEIRALVAAGVPAHDALAAGSWAARAYLGLPGLAEGAPADAVVYDSDPRADLRQLGHPRAVILRGQPIRRASQ